MADSDYRPLKDLEVVWEDGDAEDRNVSIGLIDDDFHEGDEQFYFVITDPHPECAGSFAIGMVMTLKGPNERGSAFRSELPDCLKPYRNPKP